jgi:hypothetical protein
MKTMAANEPRMRWNMREKLNTEDKVSLAEALRMEMSINEALVAVLVQKGILTYDEIMAKVIDIKLKEKEGVLYSEVDKKALN